MTNVSRLLLLAFFPFLFSMLPRSAGAQKREFRGAWIQVVNGQLKGLSTEAVKSRLLTQLDALQGANINAVMFQVRAEADALYPSDIEPWSRYLTGTQGAAPSPYWDPLQFMIDECHRRGMELHAWINPYRAKTTTAYTAAANHISLTDSTLMVPYGTQLLFDPAEQRSRDRICQVVTDIVSRYDVDGIHIDDYFYPYPIAGQEYPDQNSYRAYGKGFSSVADWRRDNVNRLIEQMHEAISRTKPWVKFGVSPFGIYRNRASDPEGSATNGLQNYDDLYADVLLWAREGWVDYLIPQIYWQVGHPVADYAELVGWWAEHTEGALLFIGQSVTNTVQNADTRDAGRHQLRQKMELQRAQTNISGSCQWYAAAIAENPSNYTLSLTRLYHPYPALQPLYSRLDSRAPGKPRKVKALWMDDDYVLFWTAPSDKGETGRATRYVVYRFATSEKVDLNNTARIVCITRDTFLRLPYTDGKTAYRYVVTALDRLDNESRAAKRKVKL